MDWDKPTIALSDITSCIAASSFVCLRNPGNSVDTFFKTSPGTVAERELEDCRWSTLVDFINPWIKTCMRAQWKTPWPQIQKTSPFVEMKSDKESMYIFETLVARLMPRSSMGRWGRQVTHKVDWSRRMDARPPVADISVHFCRSSLIASDDRISLSCLIPDTFCVQLKRRIEWFVFV